MPCLCFPERKSLTDTIQMAHVNWPSSQSLLFSQLAHMAISYPAISSLIHLPQCPILLGLPLSFPFNWSLSSHCNTHAFAGHLLLSTYLQVCGSCFMSFKKKNLGFFLSFQHPFIVSFFSLRSSL